MRSNIQLPPRTRGVSTAGLKVAVPTPSPKRSGPAAPSNQDLLNALADLSITMNQVIANQSVLEQRLADIQNDIGALDSNVIAAACWVANYEYSALCYWGNYQPNNSGGIDFTFNGPSAPHWD
jgi:hypothetical protein